MSGRQFWVYILISASGNAMYIGVTNNLENRVLEHRVGKGSLFSKQYRVTRLVYAEEHDNPTDAIAREKQLKGWRRERKNELVRTINPEFRELMPNVGLAESPLLRSVRQGLSS
jgi:putative endonuclease